MRLHWCSSSTGDAPLPQVEMEKHQKWSLSVLKSLLVQKWYLLEGVLAFTPQNILASSIDNNTRLGFLLWNIALKLALTKNEVEIKLEKILVVWFIMNVLVLLKEGHILVCWNSGIIKNYSVIDIFGSILYFKIRPCYS